MTQERLLEIINTVLDSAQKPLASAISTNTRLREDLGMDSFNLAELTVRVEQETGIDVFDDGLINTVGEIHDKLGFQ